MTISVEGPIIQRPWRGYDDPGLPVGMYVAQASLFGDASAGDQITIFSFQSEDNPASSRLYSIEAIWSTNSNSGTFLGFVEFNTRWFTGIQPMQQRQLMFTYRDNDRSESAMDYSTLPRLPWFLGASTPNTGEDTQVLVGMNNQGATVELRTVIEGYIWEPRSQMAVGGLRRPVDSLYGK